jgi:hypothetical protein
MASLINIKIIFLFFRLILSAFRACQNIFGSYCYLKWLYIETKDRYQIYFLRYRLFVFIQVIGYHFWLALTNVRLNWFFDSKCVYCLYFVSYFVYWHRFWFDSYQSISSKLIFIDVELFNYLCLNSTSL